MISGFEFNAQMEQILRLYSTIRSILYLTKPIFFLLFQGLHSPSAGHSMRKYVRRESFNFWQCHLASGNFCQLSDNINKVNI